MTEEQVFLAALDLPNSAERCAYLEKACGGDADFRRQVEDLLAAHFKSGEFLDEPVGKQIGAGSSTPINDNTLSVHTNLGGDAVADEKKSELVEGEDFYREGPYIVFTEKFLKKRGYCCESGCRHDNIAVL